MKIVNEKEFNEVYNNGIVLVDFYADWCGPCKMVAPVLDELSSEVTDVTFVKVNVDNDSALAQKYGVQSIPTLILFKDGEIVDKAMGFQPKPGLLNFINKAK